MLSTTFRFPTCRIHVSHACGVHFGRRREPTWISVDCNHAPHPLMHLFKIYQGRTFPAEFPRANTFPRLCLSILSEQKSGVIGAFRLPPTRGFSGTKMFRIHQPTLGYSHNTLPSCRIKPHIGHVERRMVPGACGCSRGAVRDRIPPKRVHR
jgi:hypothetical protein